MQGYSFCYEKLITFMRAMNFRTLPRLRIARLLTNDDGNAEYLEEKPSSRKRSNNKPVRLFESVEITDCYSVDLEKYTENLWKNYRNLVISYCYVYIDK